MFAPAFGQAWCFFPNTNTDPQTCPPYRVECGKQAANSAAILTVPSFLQVSLELTKTSVKAVGVAGILWDEDLQSPGVSTASIPNLLLSPRHPPKS